MPRKPKYPNSDQTIQAFFNSVSDAYNHPSADEAVDGHKKQELLSEEFQISRIKVRKILITTGDITSPTTAQIRALIKSGMKINEVCEKLKISLSTANSLLPYSKGVYGLDVSAAADRTALYRARLQSVQELHESVPSGTVEEQKTSLWRCVCLFAGYPFQTSGRGSRGGAKFRYTVSEAGSAGGRHYDGESVDGFGNELFIINSAGEKREKGISRSSVDYAFRIVRETDGAVTGPKQLKVYGSSYVFAIFKRFGLV